MIHRTEGAGGRIWRDDLVAVLLSTGVVGGLFLDGWSHLVRYGGRLNSFFTPWHGLLYAAFTANAAWVVGHNQHLWRIGVEPHPALYKFRGVSLRYPFAILGLAVATVGMLGDLVWHTALGNETDVARVIAPFHVVLVLGASLLLAAPLRSAWHASAEYPARSGLVRLAPPLLSLTLLATLMAFLLQWASPFMEWTGTPSGVARVALRAATGIQPTMAAKVLFASITLSTPLLLAMKRWVLPAGAALVLYSTVAFAMAALGSFHLAWTVLPLVAGGAAIEAGLVITRDAGPTARLYAVAISGPLVAWPAYFAMLNTAYDAAWPLDFAVGVSVLAALMLGGLAFLLSLPDAE